VSPPAAPPRRIRTALGGLAVLLAALCWWIQSSSTPADGPVSGQKARSTTVSTSPGDGPRRLLPTRTEADAPAAETGSPLVCPLKVVDAESRLHLDGLPEWTPPATRFTLEPPVLPALSVDLDDTTATIAAADAARLLRLPWAGGTVSGHIPGLGESYLALDGDHCGLMVVLVDPEGPSPGLRCPLSDELTLTDGHQLVLAAGPFEGRPLRSRFDGEALVLRDAPDQGEAWLHTRSQPPVLVSWEGDACDPIELPELATLAVEVVGRTASSPVWVKGCGLTRRLDNDQDRIELEVAAVPCAMEAWRIDGALRALSPLETVDPSPGRTTRVRLVLPETETGGIGIAFRTGEDAVSVRHVRPDSPAWEAGLRVGDRIVAVDGEPTGGLQQHDFIALGTGPVGSEVVLTVAAEDGTVDEIVLQRAALPN